MIRFVSLNTFMNTIHVIEDANVRYYSITVIPKNLVCHHLNIGWETEDEGVYALAEVVKEGYPDCTSLSL